MSQIGLRMLILIAILPNAVFAAESPHVQEIVELSAADREALLAAPRTVMNIPPSVELSDAIQAAAIESIKVERFTEKLNDQAAQRVERDTITTYQGWIRYAPIPQSDSRLYRPVVLCVAQDERMNWTHCQDESWIRLQTDDMEKPIRFNGELSDVHLAQIFDFVDQAGLVSTTDGQLVTSEKIYEIIKYPHAGNRVNVYVTTEEKGFTDVIYLAQITSADGRSEFEISDFRCGQR